MLAIATNFVSITCLAAVDTTAILERAQEPLSKAFGEWLDETNRATFLTDFLPRATQFMSALKGKRRIAPEFRELRDRAGEVVQPLLKLRHKKLRDGTALTKAQVYFRDLRTSPSAFNAVIASPEILLSLNLSLELSESETQYSLTGLDIGAQIMMRANERPLLPFGPTNLVKLCRNPDLDIHEINPTAMAVAWSTLEGAAMRSQQRSYIFAEDTIQMFHIGPDGDTLLSDITEPLAKDKADLCLILYPHGAMIENALTYLASGGIGIFLTEDPEKLRDAVQSLDKKRRQVRIAHYGTTPLIAAQIREMGLKPPSFIDKEASYWAFPLVFVKA